MDNRRGGGIRRQHIHNNREYNDHDGDNHIKNDANSLERGMFTISGGILKNFKNIVYSGKSFIE